MKNADNKLIQRNDEHFRELLTALPNVSVQGYDKNRRVVYWNYASELLYGYTEEEATGRLLEELIIPDYMKQGVVAAHHAWVHDGEAIPAAELELISKNKTVVPVFSSHVMLYQHTNNPEMYCVDIDLSKERQKEKQVAYLTKFDQQTGLYNKDYLFEFTKDLLKNKKSLDESHAVIFVGIDDLTQINNVYGYEEGDKLILKVIEHLQNCMGSNGFIARYSGDVFVIVITMNKQPQLLERIISTIKEVGRTPYTFDNEIKQITLSAGICIDDFVPYKHIDLLNNAEVAMNQAKNSGKNQYLFYEPEFDNKIQRSYSLLSALSSTYNNKQFSLVFQPQFDQAQNIVSCEALLRWNHPKLGSISPAEFIPLAESKNKIKNIDRWVVNAVIKQLKKWRELGIQTVPVFINISGQSLCDINFINILSSLLTDSGIPYSQIGIEITEYALISESDALVKQMRWLQDRGVSIALDDFGTGYSSLNYLTKFPLNYIKIDKTFVKNSSINSQDAAIMKAIFALSESLDMGVICEGVETEKQLKFIKNQSHFALLQGYLFSKPVMPTDFETLLNSASVKL